MGQQVWLPFMLACRHQLVNRLVGHNVAEWLRLRGRLKIFEAADAGLEE